MKILKALNCSLALAVGLLCCLNAQATLRLQEGFNYQPGLLGMSSPWVNPTTFIQVTSDTLRFRGLADCSPSGNAVSVSAGGSAPAVTYRPFTNLLSGSKAYFSFLIKYASVNASVNFAGLLPFGITVPGGKAVDPCDLVVIGTTGGYFLGIRAKNGTSSYVSTVMALGTVYFVVVKYDFTTGRASLYLNPAPGGSEPGAADASSSGDPVANLNYVFLRVFDATAGSFLIDTLRVGTDWGEVTPWAPPPPGIRLAFLTAPAAGTVGRTLARTAVQIQDVNSDSVPSNSVPITLTLNRGEFESGTTTVSTDAAGTAAFNDLLLSTAGSYTLTASASGAGTGLEPATSTPFVVGPPNPILSQGHALSAFLDSLEVERYWANKKSVNWLTGADGGTGTNKTIGTASHCSAFAAAVAKVLGVYLLRPWDELDMGLANLQADWLRNEPAGWYHIAHMTNAQRLANMGTLVVASLEETNGTSGHIAIVRPSTKSDAEILVEGPQECQSGLDNYNSIDVKTGFIHHDPGFPDRIFYYGHAIAGPINPVNPVFGPSSLSTSVFRVNATSIVGRKYKLQSTIDFVTWSDVLSYTNSNEGTNFWCETPLTDAMAGGVSKRFYRLLAQ